MNWKDKIMMKIVNAIMTLMFLISACCLIWFWIEGEMSFVEFAFSLALVFLLYKVYKSRLVQYLVFRLMGWNPVGDFLEQEKQRMRRESIEWINQHNQQMEENKRRGVERSRAIDNAIFHENQAKRYAGTNDGYWHANMAKKYRNDAGE